MRALFAALVLCGTAVASRAIPPPLQVIDRVIVDSTLPASLADYGFFTDAARQIPVAAVMPYRLNTPLWSDGADKLRFVYVPAGQTASANGDGLLGLPVGSALIKTFRMEGRLIETRVLLHRAEGWVALPYIWNEAQTEARLAVAGGRVQLTTPAGETISYAIPNKNQCKECHASGDAVTPIGPKARNLSADWLAAFHRAGRLDSLPEVARRVPLWEDRANTPTQSAARGYLDANCGHCHNPAGSASNSGLDLTWEQADPIKLGIGKRPVAAGRGSGGFDFDIVPGAPERSILMHRMQSLEGGISMPELGRASRDPEGEAVVARWIREMGQ